MKQETNELINEVRAAVCNYLTIAVEQGLPFPPHVPADQAFLTLGYAALVNLLSESERYSKAFKCMIDYAQSDEICAACTASIASATTTMAAIIAPLRGEIEQQINKQRESVQ